jgi:PAS domain S-box-containing protein
LLRFRREPNYIYQTKHRTRFGRDIPVEVSGRVIAFRGADAVLCTARDLSERMEAHRALQQSEARIRSIIDASPMGILLYELHPDDRLELVGVNPSAAQILQINPDDYLGKSLEEAFPGLAKAELPLAYRRVCREGVGYFREQLAYADEVISGAFEVHAFQTEPGRMAVLFFDVTERKKTEQAVRESEEKYRLLFSAEKDAILIFDHETLQLVDVNDAALHLYGYSQADLCARNFADLHDSDDDDCLDALRQSRQTLISCTHRRSDGDLFPVEITSGPFDWAGRKLGVAIVRDISEREKIHRLKDEMLSSISHEMRTPLTAILGFTELMLSNQFEYDQERHFLKLSYQEGERLRDLIDDLLDLQRLRAGFLNEVMEPVDVGLLLYEVASLFVVPDSSHPVRVSCADGLPKLNGDSRKLHRALKNLLANAIKYSPDGGEIGLRADLLADGSAVRIAVEDHGLGIPEEARDQVFDRFFRVYHPQVKNIRGTGLGLALVKEIVRVHSGRIWFESTLGKGSTFFLELPVPGPECLDPVPT